MERTTQEKISLQIFDQLNRSVVLADAPQRIVSLVPSITETVIDLGATDQLLGRTKFCIHPKDKVSSILRIGGTKNIRVEDILDLKPDLILANKEENVKADVMRLAAQVPTYISDIKTVSDSCRMIKDLGSLLGKEDEAVKMTDQLDKLTPKINAQSPRVLYLIWQDPYMSIGNDTFIHHMMSVAGFNNVTALETRYPELDMDEVMNRTDIIFLSSEPYPFKEKHKQALEDRYAVKVHLVDGEIFSWYGSRMLKASSYFEALSSQI